MDTVSAAASSVDAVPWLLKVQCYIEFWDKFLQELALSKQHSCNVQALSLVASNVWGETRLSTREIYKGGPIVLVPEIFTSEGNAGLVNAESQATESRQQTKMALQDSSSTAAQEAPDATSFSHDTSTYEPEPSRSKLIQPLSKTAVAFPCDSDASEINDGGGRTSSLNEEDDEELAQSDRDQEQDMEILDSARSQRYWNNQILRGRVQEALGSPDSTLWPPRPLAFPRKHLFYDAKQYPSLFREHEKLWMRFSARYVENTYMHPVNLNEQKRAYGTKYKVTQLQAELLSHCIEWLGIQTVAQAFLKPEYAIPFFLVTDYIRLDELTPEQLEIHLRYIRTPWKSPELCKRTVTWWETLVQTRCEDSIALSVSAKRKLAIAHFRGLLVFDRKWLQMACKEPWKSMLETYVVDASYRKKQRRQESLVKQSAHNASKKLSVRRSASQNEPERFFHLESEDDSSSHEREVLSQLRRSKGRYKRVRY